MNKMDFLVALYIFCIAVAELMGGKTFPLVNIFGFQLNASVAIFVFPLIFTINDIITEVYGRERARSLIRSSLDRKSTRLNSSHSSVSRMPSSA